MDLLRMKTFVRSHVLPYDLVHVYLWIKYYINTWRGPLKTSCKNYKKICGVNPNLRTPKTLNEKIVWLKLYDHRDVMQKCSDKYLSRQFFVDMFGEEVKQYLVPLLYQTPNWRDITMDILPDVPFIIKPTHSSGSYQIIKDKANVNIKMLRRACMWWLKFDYAKFDGEWQYAFNNRSIIIEKLLQCKDGYIPNDYKLHYINGELQFVYCAIGRETTNKRNIYDANWNPVDFTWIPKEKDPSTIRGEEIDPPASFHLMKKYADEIAKLFDYVRVDFYDVDGHMYFGEVTLHHGGGHDVFTPAKYDQLFGEKLHLTCFNTTNNR